MKLSYTSCLQMALSLCHSGQKIFGALFYDFLDFVLLSSVKKIRRRTSFDPYPPDIVKYRNLRPPSPPKKVRRLLWTAPNMKTIVVLWMIPADLH